MTETCEDSQQTWLEVAIEQAHRAEDEKYTELKAQLRQEIDNLREKVQKNNECYY